MSRGPVLSGVLSPSVSAKAQDGSPRLQPIRSPPPSPRDTPSLLDAAASAWVHPQHPVANHTLTSTLALRCGEPTTLSKLGRASRYPNELAGSSSGDPLSFSRDHRLCPLSYTTGSALPFPPCCHLQLRSRHCCSHSLCSGRLIPDLDPSDVLSADTVVGGISGCLDMNHEKGQNMLRQAFSCCSGSPISLLSVQCALPPGSLPDYSKSDSAWIYQLSPEKPDTHK